ncbi:MAG: hypothetical protein K6E62_10050 [Lachnospiraceae bacterium]|nr:hypothetical protein [Lachnospiraceae bacterium]
MIQFIPRNENSEHNPSAKKLSRPELYTVPAITLVLYFGKDHWYRNHNLKDLLNIPDRLEPYVNDYKINVFEISWLNKNEISRFKSDFGIVADFFVNIRNNPGYIPNNPKEIIHTDEVLALIASVSGDTRYLHINDQKEIV